MFNILKMLNIYFPTSGGAAWTCRLGPASLPPVRGNHLSKTTCPPVYRRCSSGVANGVADYGYP